MSYAVTVGNPVSVRHIVRSLDGTSVVSGEAANITATLIDPDGASSGLTVTITEVGSTGYYTASFSPNATGIWVLTLENTGSSTDLASVDYAVHAIAGVAADSTGLLTTKDRVKQRLWNSTSGTTWDTLLDNLISEVSADVQVDLQRTVAEATYTQYFNGSGSSNLWLREGPLVSVTSVSLVEYGDDGGGGRGETLTTVYAYDYVIDGLRSETEIGAGRLILLSGCWTRGVRNYKVVYTAGWDSVPEAIVKAATDMVVAEFLQRESKGLASKIVGEGQESFLTPMQARQAMAYALTKYRLRIF